MRSIAQHDYALQNSFEGDWSSKQDHIVQFYEQQDFLLRSLSRFVSSSLAIGNFCLVVSTTEHHDSMFKLLQKQNVDLSSAIASESYLFLDAEETLSSFMVDGNPDADLFRMILANRYSGRQSKEIAE